MIKRKGFTLVELLAVIVILAVIAVITVPIMLKIIHNTKVSAFERQKELIVDAAKKYAVLKPEEIEKGYVTLEELISANLIRPNIKDVEGNVIDKTFVVNVNGYGLISATEYSDNYITINNSIGAPVKKIVISGKSEQTTTQGKNLLPLSIGSITKDTMNATIEADGSVHIYGTITTNSTVLILTGGLSFTSSTASYLTRRLNTIPVGTEICGNYNNITGSSWGTSPKEPRMYIKTSDGGNYSIASSSGYMKNTVSSDKIISLVYIYMPTVGTVVDYKFYPQIETGGTPTSYEQFVPNSPSPDYPSVINSANNFDLVSSGKNLLNYKTPSGSYQATYSEITNGLRISGKWYISFNIPLEVGSKYVMSWNILQISGESIPKWRLMYSDGTYSSMVSSGIPITVVKPVVSLLLYIGLGTESIADFTNIQLEKNSTSTLYESYQGQTIKFSNTLRSLPDGTKDYIEIDDVNKTAKLYQNVGELIFNGSTTKVSKNDSLSTSYGYYAYGVNKTSGIGLCSHFLHTDAYPLRIEYARKFSTSTSIVNAIYLNFYGIVSDNNANLSDATQANAWLSSQYSAGTPVTVQYKLATPIVTTIMSPETYIPLKTYKGMTNIYKTGIQSNINTEIYSND